jgi:hypothetical protein
VATTFAYGSYPLQCCSKNADWVADTVKAVLLLNTYTPDIDNHVFLSDISAQEASGGGYARVTLGTKTRTYDSATNTTKLSCADVTVSGLTLTGVRYMAFFHDSGTPSTSPLVAYVDFGSDQAPASQALVYTVPTTGIVSFAVA